jgi:D-glycero-alpha-D-manno-heptose-7-phosphate kinase
MRSASGESRTITALHAMKEQVAPMRAALEAGDYAGMGTLLHEAWQVKQRVSSGISTGAIDAAYATARTAGALGGKITGAGGGGFMLLLVPPDAQQAVQAALEPLGLRRMCFGLEWRGVHTIVDGGYEVWPPGMPAGLSTGNGP